MLLTKKPMMRVIPGPDPNQYGIIAKPYQPPKENIMEKNKRVEEIREQLVRQEDQLKNDLLKIDFFDTANKKSKLKQVKRSVAEVMNQRSMLLNERRNKLKQMLAQEELAYEQQLGSLIESPLERAAKLRERARKLKQEKEKEHQEFVHEKLDQKWRAECDELRTLQSKYITKELGGEHLRQMDEKIYRQKEQIEEEKIFTDLWYQEIAAKKAREERDAQAALERNMQTAIVLKEQIQILEKQKEKEKWLIMENARLSQERVNIDKIERELAHREKLRQQAKRKEELDTSVRIKNANAARHEQEEMALDLKLLEEALSSTQFDDENRSLKKQELFEESKRYREYLRQQLEQEKQYEKELEKIIAADVEKQFQKRLNQWKAEKEARKKLLNQVVAERRLQIEEKMRRNAEHRRQLEIEKQEMNERIAKYVQQEEDEFMNMHSKNKAFQNDLIGQMEYNSKRKDRQKWLDYHEYQSCVRAEESYQKRLAENVKSMKIDHLHPIRHSNLQENIIRGGSLN